MQSSQLALVGVQHDAVYNLTLTTDFPSFPPLLLSHGGTPHGHGQPFHGWEKVTSGTILATEGPSKEARLVFLLGQGREEKRGWLGPRKVRYHWKSGGG